MISPELISMGVSAIGGFAMKAFAMKMQNDQARFDRMMQAIKAVDESADKAAARVPNDKAGNWIRRFIVISILFAVIGGPFLLSVFDKPVAVEIQTPVKSWLFGLFTTGGESVFYEMRSYLLIPEIRMALLSLVGFYFGSSLNKK